MKSSWQILEKWLEFNMSHPVNTEILENLFEECLDRLAEAGHDINNPNAQYVAEIRAKQLFEELAQ